MSTQKEVKRIRAELRALIGGFIDSHDMEGGLCIDCYNEQSNVEPDATLYTCECCGKDSVFGKEYIAITLG